MSQQQDQFSQKKQSQEKNLSGLFGNKAVTKPVEEIEFKPSEVKGSIGIRGSKKLLKNLKVKASKKDTLNNLKQEDAKEDDSENEADQNGTDTNSSNNMFSLFNAKNESTATEHKKQESSNQNSSTQWSCSSEIKSIFQNKNQNTKVQDKRQIPSSLNQSNNLFSFTNSNNSNLFQFTQNKEPLKFGFTQGKNLFKPPTTESVPLFANNTTQAKSNLFSFNTNFNSIPPNYLHINSPILNPKQQSQKIEKVEDKHIDCKRVKIKGQEHLLTYSKNVRLKDSIVVCMASRKEFLGCCKRQMKICYYNNFIGESAAPMESLVMEPREESIQNYPNLLEKKNGQNLFQPTIVVHSKELFEPLQKPIFESLLGKAEVMKTVKENENQQNKEKNNETKIPGFQGFSGGFLTMLNQKSKLSLEKGDSQKKSEDYTKNKIKVLQKIVEQGQEKKQGSSIDDSNTSLPLFGKQNLKFSFDPTQSKSNSKSIFGGFI